MPFLVTAHASGWLRCAAHGMRDITREPMWPSEELENESEEMTLLWICLGLSLSHCSIRDGDTMQADASSSKYPTTPPSKRRRSNSEWAEGREWLKHDNKNGVMFCEWCICFDRDEHRNQFEGMCINEA